MSIAISQLMNTSGGEVMVGVEGSYVGEMRLFTHSADDVIEMEDNTVWLRSGNIAKHSDFPTAPKRPDYLPGPFPDFEEIATFASFQNDATAISSYSFRPAYYENLAYCLGDNKVKIIDLFSKKTTIITNDSMSSLTVNSTTNSFGVGVYFNGKCYWQMSNTGQYVMYDVTTEQIEIANLVSATYYGFKVVNNTLVCYGVGQIAYSTDGVNWEYFVRSGTYTDIIFHQGNWWLAQSSSGIAIVPLNWDLGGVTTITAASMGAALTNFKLAANGNTVVAIGNVSSAIRNCVSANNGVTWLAQTPPTGSTATSTTLIRRGQFVYHNSRWYFLHAGSPTTNESPFLVSDETGGNFTRPSRFQPITSDMFIHAHLYNGKLYGDYYLRGFGGASSNTQCMSLVGIDINNGYAIEFISRLSAVNTDAYRKISEFKGEYIELTDWHAFRRTGTAKWESFIHDSYTTIRGGDGNLYWLSVDTSKFYRMTDWNVVEEITLPTLRENERVHRYTVADNGSIVLVTLLGSTATFYTKSLYATWVEGLNRTAFSIEELTISRDSKYFAFISVATNDIPFSGVGDIETGLATTADIQLTLGGTIPTLSKYRDFFIVAYYNSTTDDVLVLRAFNQSGNIWTVSTPINRSYGIVVHQAAAKSSRSELYNRNRVIVHEETLVVRNSLINIRSRYGLDSQATISNSIQKAAGFTPTFLVGNTSLNGGEYGLDLGDDRVIVVSNATEIKIYQRIFYVGSLLLRTLATDTADGITVGVGVYYQRIR